MHGGGRLGHRPLLAEAPHCQEADPAPAAAGEGGEHRQHSCGSGCFVWGNGCWPPSTTELKHHASAL